MGPFGLEVGPDESKLTQEPIGPPPDHFWTTLVVKEFWAIWGFGEYCWTIAGCFPIILVALVALFSLLGSLLALLALAQACRKLYCPQVSASSL